MRLWRGLISRRSSGEPGARLIVGLGNPGRRHRGTRHNLGREVVKALAERWGVALDQLWASARFGLAHRGGSKCVLAVPITFMNESGRAVAPLVRRFELEPHDILVVVDDLDLPLGALRLRVSGGSGGHRGLSSVTKALGTEEYPRLRLGIGRPPEDWDPARYVLARFTDAERAVADGAISDAVEALEQAVDQGLDVAMNTWNR